MAEQLVCPLCNQPVPKKLYDSITGIWDARQKAVKKLEGKRKELEKKEKSP